MARVHFVKKARKSNKRLGIKKGKPYYWWQHRNCPKQVSLSPPKPSQTTRSEYYAQAYSIQESVIESGFPSDVADSFRSASEEVRSLAEEQREKVSNMEERFPNGCPSMETLNERADACDALADELDSAADQLDGVDPEVTDDGDAASEIESIAGGISWDFG